ncbi:hypothetical protein [Undibacterium terreum]|uniref:Uncharacterized protein n=1 Tax=Undibacterium terreum TaxID=1224302 RepID=A0A916XR61_9BURK|nr:hypothetical protein [Undibacterium terreum]GGC94745.1 hypothetical protein GCM10011396_47620 [Undibacterium terreum]
MPLAPNRISRDRANFSGTLTAAEIASLLDDKELGILQTSSQPDILTCKRLNESLFALRPELELRIYDGNGAVCDLSFLKHMDCVRHFSADCLQQAAGLQHLASLKNLHSLAIGIADLPDFDFLNQLPDGELQTLYIGKSGARPEQQPDLQVLQRFGNLRILHLEGQQNRLEQIGGLAQLHDLTLRSVKLENLEFLRSLPKLCLLDIKQCQIQDWSALRQLQQLQFLELWQIRGLQDLSFISSMTGLQNFFLQALGQVAALPDVSGLHKLRRVYLHTLRKLSDIKALEQAPALQEFAHVADSRWQPEDYAGLLKLPTLTSAAVDFGNQKKNQVFRDMLHQRGLREYVYTEFQFI